MRHRRKLRGRQLKRHRRVMIISIFVIFLTLSVGYAAFQTVININIKGNIVRDETCVNGHVWEFSQKDEAQEFKVPCSGEYKVELWGAQGGDADNNSGGLGGYTFGIINFKINKKYYIYVGSEGKGGAEYKEYTGGYNGGANAHGQARYTINDSSPRYYSSGGGATDIRINNGDWNDFTSLKSRFMVAGAGSGTYKENNTIPISSPAGGLAGYDGVTKNSSYSAGTGASQTLGGYYICNSDLCKSSWSSYGVSYGEYYYSGFGFSNHSRVFYSAGGGSGYYGGGSALHAYASGGGGSSFISGHDGCDAISEQSTSDNIIHTGQSVHYSGLKFTDTVMIDGAGCKWTTSKTSDCSGMPTHDGIGTMTGNEGDGFAKITLLNRKYN